VRRIQYLVVDERPVSVRPDHDEKERVYGTQKIMVRQVLAEDEPFDPPAFVRRGIAEKGWRIIVTMLPDGGLNDHGYADWRSVADKLAEVLGKDSPTQDEISDALVAYSIAQTEESLAQEMAIEPSTDDEG